MAKKKQRDPSRILKGLHRNLNLIIVDSQIKNRDPFDAYIAEEVFPSRKAVEGLWSDLYEYYRVTEDWSVGGEFLGYEQLPAYVVDLARKHGATHITPTVLKDVGGYLNSQWLVFVPFTKSSDAFETFKHSGLKKTHTKIGPEMWISSIAANEAIQYRWIYRTYKKLIRNNLKIDLRDKASTFRHHLCQIGGAKYNSTNTVNGHYFIFRLRGSLRSLSSKNDYSAFFILFCRGLYTSAEQGERTSELMPSNLFGVEPDGIIGIGLKDFEPWRFRRNTMIELNVGIDNDLVKQLKKERFYQICTHLFSGTVSDRRWKSLRVAADVLYQFLENESNGGNTYTRDAVSTVLLCSASEALLSLGGKPIKKSLSALIATILYPSGGEDFKETHNLLDRGYFVRNKFVHSGEVLSVDNKKLFFHIFSAWLRVAQFYLKNPDEESGLIEFVKSKLRLKSQVYRDIFHRDYLSVGEVPGL